MAETIQVDEQAILALQRVTTGADIHDSTALICNYRGWCRLGNAAEADKAKARMAVRAIELIRRRSGT